MGELRSSPANQPIQSSKRETAIIDALIAGRLHTKPERRTGKNGKPFVTAKLRAIAGDGESLFVNVIAFDEAPCAALLALVDGDSVALAGSITPKTWTDKQGNARPSLDMVAAQVLTAYHVTKRRRAMEGERSASQRQQPDDFPPEPLNF